MGTPLTPPGGASAALAALVAGSLTQLEADAQLRAALSAAPAAVRESLAAVLAMSDFVAHACTRDRQMLADLLASGELQQPLTAADYTRRAPLLVAEPAGSEAQALAQLRRWRRRELTRIAWRDLAGWADLTATLAELSAFADAAIRAAAAHARATLSTRYGEPRSVSGESQPLVVVGMGKLGGGELNFSSDVDLVLLFPEHGETDGERRISNEEFFTRLGQSLVRLLETPTADGFVLRVDLRLRPFGDSGPLAASFAFFEDYLPRHGRAWERYAYVKARPITAAERYAELESAAVRPFVYRRYLDYGVFESLREMRVLIEREMSRRELADNVKLGPGGIREIEFIVQALQLTRGGRDRRLQTPSLCAALARLGETRLLPDTAVNELGAAYVFLRRLENRLQMLADSQVHRLPAQPLDRERIALAMGERDWAALEASLAAHRESVSRHFRLVLFGAGRDEPPAVCIDLGRFWDSQAETAALAEALAEAGFRDSAEAARLLLELRASALVRKLDEPGRQRLQALLPALLADVAHSSAQLPVLRRVLAIIEATGKRSAYFALLRENAAARARLVELCRHGDFLAAQIAAHPLLLDELIDERLLTRLPTRADFARELAERLEELREDDPEQQVEALRQFQRAALFRVAVADLTGLLPLMQVSDRLTDIAELIVERAMQLGWRQITAQFGVPLCGERGRGARGEHLRDRLRQARRHGARLLLGSRPGVSARFARRAPGDQRRQADRQPAVLRAPRAAHRAPADDAFGRRPAVRGRRAAAAERQGRPAGHQHRGVCRVPAPRGLDLGAPGAAARPRGGRRSAAARALRGGAPRRAVRITCARDSLRAEVRACASACAASSSRADAGRFDIKQDRGGIADIEFLAQYWALRWAREYPPVAMFADTIRQLESVASADLVPQASVDVLTAAYRAYRARIHRPVARRRRADRAGREFADRAPP